MSERAAFQKLEVYRLAEKLADAVWHAVLRWNIFAKDTIGKQLVKAAESIGANIAEGYGRGSPQDNHRFVRISRGSLNETIYWLRSGYRKGLIAEGQVQRIHPLLAELGPRLNAYLKSIERDCARPVKRATKRQPTTNNKQPTNGK